MRKQRTFLMMTVTVIALIAVCFSSMVNSIEMVKANELADESQNDASSSTTELDAHEVEMTKVTAVTKVLENDRYALYIDEATGNVRIVNVLSGTEWLGSPIVPTTTMPNNIRYMESPVHIRFTIGADIISTYSLKDPETTLTIEVLEDAVHLHYHFGNELISFTMVYELAAQGLEVSIPYDSIKEEGVARLISIQPLPFMNAAHETDDGAMLLPDGSGALLYFREEHQQYLKGYSEHIYGPDLTFITHDHDMITAQGMRVHSPKEYIALPVFGMYRNGVGTLGIVMEGEYDAKITGTPAGIRAISMYRSAVEFTYRKNDLIFIGSSGQIPYYQGQTIAGDRRVRFTLLEGDEANYVGMAKAYRNYLLEERGIQPIITSPILSIDILGGIRRKEMIGSTFIRMTTFPQVQEIIDDLAARGITNVELTLNGWSKGGLYGHQPAQFPAARQLGGKKGLDELINYADRQGVSLLLSANYVRALSTSKHVNARKDATRGLDREVVNSFNYYVATRWRNANTAFHFLKPDRVFDRYITDDIERFAKLNIGGVHLQYMGDTLYSDEDRKHFFSREQTAEVWKQTLQQMREQVGRTTVDYGHAFTFGYIDHIKNAPLQHSSFIYTDEAVPFYQLVMHGLIPYSGKPINLYEDTHVEFLKAIEYGAWPSFEVTHAPTSMLQRTIEDRLFSSEYNLWQARIAEHYEQLMPLYELIAGQQMTDHAQLMKGVYETTYSNGVKVYTNYNQVDVTVDGISISAMSYAVKGE